MAAKAAVKESGVAETMRKLAMKLPGAEQSIACAGTAAECRTVKAGGKAFLFLRKTDVMLKLRDLAAEASRQPDRYKVGAGGWTMVSYEALSSMPSSQHAKLIDDSYRAVGGGKETPKGASSRSKKKVVKRG